MSTPYDTLEPLLWPKGSRPNVWSVLDGARDRDVWATLYASTMPRECLYAGSLHPALERAAPYLVQLEHDDRQTIRLINRAWGNSWGIFLTADGGLGAMRKHLRKLLKVTGPSGKRLLFRYFDPRVTRVFLPTCSTPQLDEWFGPVQAVLCEGEEDDEVLQFRIDPARRKLETIVWSLTSPPASDNTNESSTQLTDPGLL